MNSSARKPCPTCPWRRSVPKRGFPGGFIDARGLLRMVRGGVFGPIMQCHCTADHAPKVCVGFALQAGPDCAAYRLAVAAGRIDHGEFVADEPLHTLESLLLTHGTLRPQPSEAADS